MKSSPQRHGVTICQYPERKSRVENICAPCKASRLSSIGNLRLSTTVGRAGEVWFLLMVDWIEYEPFGAKKKEIKIVNKQAATVESLIDGHRVKKCYFMNFMKPQPQPYFVQVQFEKSNFFHQSIIFIACPAKSSTKMQMRKKAQVYML